MLGQLFVYINDQLFVYIYTFIWYLCGLPTSTCNSQQHEPWTWMLLISSLKFPSEFSKESECFWKSGWLYNSKWQLVQNVIRIEVERTKMKNLIIPLDATANMFSFLLLHRYWNHLLMCGFLQIRIHFLWRKWLQYFPIFFLALSQCFKMAKNGQKCLIRKVKYLNFPANFAAKVNKQLTLLSKM